MGRSLPERGRSLRIRKNGPSERGAILVSATRCVQDARLAFSLTGIRSSCTTSTAGSESSPTLWKWTCELISHTAERPRAKVSDIIRTDPDGNLAFEDTILYARTRKPRAILPEDRQASRSNRGDTSLVGCLAESSQRQISASQHAEKLVRLLPYSFDAPDHATRPFVRLRVGSHLRDFAIEVIQFLH